MSKSTAMVAALACAVMAQAGGPPVLVAQRGGGNPPTEANVAIPMRDGVTLGADLYLPPGAGPFPVLLTVTPYGKNGAARTAATQAARGYAVVAVDSDRKSVG